MTNEPWRLACGRCGSQQVLRQQQNGKWMCGMSHNTPAVYDLKTETWRHVADEMPETYVTDPPETAFEPWTGVLAKE